MHFQFTTDAKKMYRLANKYPETNIIYILGKTKKQTKPHKFSVKKKKSYGNKRLKRKKKFR